MPFLCQCRDALNQGIIVKNTLHLIFRNQHKGRLNRQCKVKHMTVGNRVAIGIGPKIHIQFEIT